MASPNVAPTAPDDEISPHPQGKSDVQVTTASAASSLSPANSAAQPADDQAPDSPGGSRGAAVRFSSKLQEIEPEHSLELTETATPDNHDPRPLSEEEQAELRNISKSLQLQHRRMSNFAFEPVSLPASRVPSNESNRPQSTSSSTTVPNRQSPAILAQTPPLTPAASQGKEKEPAKISVEPPQAQMTPQSSDPQTAAALSTRENEASDPNTAARRNADGRPSSAGQVSARPLEPTQRRLANDVPRPVSMFSPGPTGGSTSPSQEGYSPSQTPHSSGTVTPPTNYSRPPEGERDDPYARSKRPPQQRNLNAIDARFVFAGNKDNRRQSSLIPGSVGQIPRASSSGDLKSAEKMAPPPAPKKDPHRSHLEDDAAAVGSKHSSMADLKKFFRIGHSHKRAKSPAPSTKSSSRHSHVPPTKSPLAPSQPFADDHGLENKWGKFGKMLGSGAGGSVRLMKRSSDGVTFAVKQFRERHSYETEREYAKKVTAEFCIGSTLHHGNIIETLDILQERGRWYEVMEYAPYDLFAIVMTGKMSREEITCCFLQIFAGVTYLHSLGLAHRDLKLDNVVVNEFGIMKIIDFGSAIVYRYPFENDIVLATGVVGSDPYLAPEVYDNTRYDPQPTDIWSLAIIFACMSLRRFPWKLPRLTDNSFKLFVSAPTPGTPTPDSSSARRQSGRSSQSLSTMGGGGNENKISEEEEEERRARSAPAGDGTEDQDDSRRHHRHSHHHHHHSHRNSSSAGADRDEGDANANTNHKASQDASSTANPPTSAQTMGATKPSVSSSGGPTQQGETIKGPWRLLRLLPRESRSIIGRMLELDPKRRATIEDMMADPWVADSQVCRQLEHPGGEMSRAAGGGGVESSIVRAENHVHTLQPSSTEPGEGGGKK